MRLVKLENFGGQTPRGDSTVQDYDGLAHNRGTVNGLPNHDILPATISNVGIGGAAGLRFRPFGS